MEPQVCLFDRSSLEHSRPLCFFLRVQNGGSLLLGQLARRSQGLYALLIPQSGIVGLGQFVYVHSSTPVIMAR